MVIFNSPLVGSARRTMRETVMNPGRMLMLLVLVWAGVASLALAGTPSVTYITSTILGNFLVAQNKSISSHDVYFTIYGTSVCKCRVACWSDPQCVAVAAVTRPDQTVECHLAEKGPTFSTLTDNLNATYFFWEVSLPGGRYYLRPEDHFLYYVVTKESNFDSAKLLCESIPGHRLAMCKTVKMMQALFNMHQELDLQLWQDLRRRTSESSLYWGDGTPFSTEVAKHIDVRSNEEKTEEVVYRTHENLLDDNTKSQTYTPLCQANLLGEQW